MLDWDRVRIFYAVAQAGSFTRASDRLSLSQSAISRQISALEDDLGVALFHRHARGLLLTEQGERLLTTAREMAKLMASTQNALGELRNDAAGHLTINTTVGLGTVWLVSQLPEFRKRYPDITLSLVVTDSDVDLSMREADVAIRLQRPTQGDLVQRPLMTAHTHIYASRDYVERNGAPQHESELSTHSLIGYGEEYNPPVPSLNWILHVGIEDEAAAPRKASLMINNVYGMLRAVEAGLGLASLPDYLGVWSPQLVRLLADVEGPTFTAYFVYPQELRASKRISAFRDFLLEKVAEQPVW